MKDVIRVLATILISISGLTTQAQNAGKAIQLDGIDDFISVPLNDHNFSRFTLECWVNVPSYDGNVHYISFQQNAYLILGDYSSGVVSTWADGLSPVDAGSTGVGSQPTLGTNEWHHLAFTFDETSQKILVDGVVVVDEATTGAVTLNNVLYNLGLTIGARYNGASQFAEGLIDEVRIWSLARSESQIDFNKGKTLVGNESGLVGYWNMDGHALDLTPFGQDGVVNGGAVFVDSDAPVSGPFSRETVGAIVEDSFNNYSAVWGDYNNDGFIDLFVPATNGPNALYRNNGDGTFSSVVAGDLGGDSNASFGASWGDYDNDGDIDLFVANSSNNSLYQNNGDETFTSVTAGDLGVASVSSYSGAWADYDNDGFLDLFVANGGINHIFHNNGDGTFTQDINFQLSDTGTSWACAWGDYDNDGDQDIYVANSGTANYLYRNDGGGAFTKITTGDPVLDVATNYSVTWIDYDNDEDLDLFVPSDGTNNLLYENDGFGNFTKILAGDLVTDFGENWSASWGDYDNNGRIDVLLLSNGYNTLYRNTGGGNFTKDNSTLITSTLGYSLGGSWEDFDNDGDLDLYVANFTGANELYRNEGNSNNSVHVDLQGVFSNRDGIGAKVWAVDANDNSHYYEANSQSGRGQANRIHIGYGSSSAKSINVQWPSGVFQSAKVSSNQTITITEHVATTDRPQVLLVTAESSQSVFDVQKKLIRDGHFEIVQSFSAQASAAATPSLATLSDYDAVMLWSNQGWADAITLGDNLADYIDQGGKVMSSVFATASIPILGRFTPDYEVINPLGQSQGVQLTLGSVPLPDHPIMNGVNSFDGGTSSYKSSSTNLASGAQVVAEWSDGSPLITIRDAVGSSGVRRVDLNFWPVSEDVFTGNWVTSTDGTEIMINSLLWLVSPPDQFTKVSMGDLVNDPANSWGVSWGDIDNDSHIDLFVGNNGNNFLYRNNGDGTFTKNTTDHLVLSANYSLSGSWGDYDNDGFQDLFVANRDGLSQLFRNNGDGTLSPTMIDFSMGQGNSGSAWGDYDNDGFLDLFVADSDGPNFLYRNDTQGDFELIDTGEIVTEDFFSYGCTWGDYDNDGFLDIYVANFSSINSLFRNNGDGTFNKVIDIGLGNDSDISLTASWGDYNNDGTLDLFVGNYSNQNNKLYQNNGDGTFTQVLNQNVTLDASSTVTSSWQDYDNDGYLDLFVGNEAQNDKLYQNNGDGSFTEIFTWVPTQGMKGSYGNGWADIDQDGFQDLFVSDQSGSNNVLFKNNGNSNSWINIKLRGIQSNASAVGAKVYITTGGMTQFREVTAQSGFTSQSSINVEFGMAGANIIDEILIEWPSGLDQYMYDVDVNQFIIIEEDITPPSVDSENFPEYYDKNGEVQLASITASDDQGINYVELHYVGISEPSDETRIIPAETTDGITFTFDLAAIDDIEDPIGVGYLFRIVDLTGNTTNSQIGTTHIEYLGNNTPTIPNLKFGTNEADYQMISIPLEINSDDVASIFGDDLGPLDNTKWRMFRYNNGNTNELSDGSSINPDEGYWLISKNTATIDVGEGSVPQVTKGSPFQLSLSSGWNQIGNPYNFTLSWQEVLDFNGNPSAVDAELSVYNRGFSSSDLLERFKGAFVFSTANITLDIPVIRNTSIQSGRTGAEEKNAIDEKNWSVDFVLKSGDFSYWQGGIGMNEVSKAAKDKFDRLTVPRFIKYLEMNFDSLSFEGNMFTKSVVPTADNQVWSFEVDSNIDEKEINIEWDNSYWGDSDMQLVLFDKVTRKSVDMRLTNNYTLYYSGKRQFNIYYGNPDFIQEKLTPKFAEIGKAHPNPFVEYSSIPFTVPADDVYNIKLTIYDQRGAVVKEYSNIKVEVGYHELTWNGTNNQGVRVSAGIYLGMMDVIGNAGKNARSTQRLVIE